MSTSDGTSTAGRSDRPEETDSANIVAAIDIGANALRMVIAEVLPDGRVEILERLQRAVRLGQDTFRQGRLGGQSMRATVDVLRDYAQLLRLYNVERVRAVATSAVREAGNADTLLDRIFMATGLRVEVIGTSEESRLIVSAVRQSVGDALGEGGHNTLVADVGGGSTLMTVLRDGNIVTSQSLRLGSIRLQETLRTSEESPGRSASLLRQEISNETASVGESLSLENVQWFVAVGGDARFAAHEVDTPASPSGLISVDTASLDKLVRRCARYSAEELAKRHGLPLADAETLTPALLIYQILLRKTPADRIDVSDVSLRDGLLLELAREVTGKKDETIQQGVIQSATSLAGRYHVDLDHARNVAEVAVSLFDEMQPDHGLSARHRLLLRVAGLLHEIGGFVSNRAHHKHSYYLIVNSEVFGLTRDELHMVAHVARYHRRSAPRPSHVEYSALPREVRVVINKLAALIRVADALVRGHITQARNLQFERQGDDLIVYTSGVADLLLEQRSIAAKGDLFEDIYGMRIRLEEA
jgi:exopolyphosphatase/guanosine-5'-triphosphate,3'-diphosphate pyrophosphatase